MSTIYVLSAVPPNSNRLLRKYGLLSGVETIKHPDVLEAARPDAKQRSAFVKKVKEVIASDRPHSVMGPSVFFTPPDPEKITSKHFIKKWDLQTIRIDLGRLIEDYPDTIVWGAELLPYDKAWRKMSDEEFDDVMADMGYASWEDFAAERSRALTLDEVREFTQMQPEDLWEYYAKSDAGKMYASNVPHAFIITPMGYIPYEYIEYVGTMNDYRQNPYSQIAPEGHLINPNRSQYMRTYFSIKNPRSSTTDGRSGSDLLPRRNPSFIVTDRAVDQLSTEMKWEIAQGIADLESRVWANIAPFFIEGPHSFMSTLMSGDDVLLGVSFADEDDEIGGPYLSYFIAEEEDIGSTYWGRTYEQITGESFADFIDRIPSDNPRLFHRKDQSREDSPLAKREHRKLMDELYDYMEAEGIAFVTHARADTTYKLMRAGKQGSMVIAAESFLPDFYGPDDHCYLVIGYYVPPGHYEPGMIRSTR